MCKQHALRIAWTIARSIAFLDFRVLRWKFTYDWKCVNTTYPVPLFMPTACFPEGPSPPFTFCSFWRRRQRLEAVYNRSCLTNLRVSRISDPIILVRGRIGVWTDYLYRLYYRAWALANEPSLLHVENVWPKSRPLSRWVGFTGFYQTIKYQNFVCSLKILMFLFSINHTSIFHVLILPIEFSRTVQRSR